MGKKKKKSKQQERELELETFRAQYKFKKLKLGQETERLRLIVEGKLPSVGSESALNGQTERNFCLII